MKDDKREKIKLRDNPVKANSKENENVEQERIEEKLSYSVPIPKPLPRAKPFWNRYLGVKVLLKLKNGIEITGILREIIWDWIRLENVFEIGRNQRVTADWILVDASSVSRLFPGNAHFE